MTIPNHDRQFFSALDAQHERELFDEQEFDHLWDMNVTESLDCDFELPQILYDKYKEYLITHRHEAETMDEWLNNQSPHDLLEWVLGGNKDAKK